MVEIEVPSLAERKEDLPLLERHFLARSAAEYGKDLRGFTQRARTRLLQHAWPGNVRELENVIGHAAMMTGDQTIDVEDLPAYLREAPRSMPEAATLAEHERLLPMQALEAAGGNQSEAARTLGIGRDALRYKLRRSGLAAGEPLRALAAVG